MTATTDLRAALREAAAMLESYSEIGFYSDAAKARAKVAEFRALADAPPTVAELLPRVDATHEVHWTDEDGMCWRIVARSFGASGGLGVETQDPDSLRWMAHTLFLPDIIKFHACLVEVSP